MSESRMRCLDRECMTSCIMWCSVWTLSVWRPVYSVVYGRGLSGGLYTVQCMDRDCLTASVVESTMYGRCGMCVGLYSR